MSGIVAIVGRPNVGKSTLFNRLTESRDAIVDEESGVTRDRIYGFVTWNGITFSVIDTGGYVKNSDDIFEGEINKQVLIAIEEADESLYWMELLIEAGIVAEERMSQLLQEANELVAILTASVITVRANLRKSQTRIKR